MDARDIERVHRLGARFALSPINPPGMIAACLARGVVPVPAAYTPQELHNAYIAGAECVKLFPAQLWNPGTVRMSAIQSSMCTMISVF